MEQDVADTAEQLSELHFLAALTDELMRSLNVAGVLSRAQMNAIEQAAAQRAGTLPRSW